MPLTFASRARAVRAAALLAAALVVAGCANRPNRAPVEDRTATPRATVAAAIPAEMPASAPEGAARPVPADTAPRPGYYVVKPGDTLIRIGLDTGQNWRDIVRWNNLENPNVIEVGQSLRIVAPGVDPSAATSRPVVASARVEGRPLDTRPGPAPAGASGAAASAPPAAPAPAPAPATREAEDDIVWSWPVTNPVSAPFDEARNKGLVFRGKAGDPVYAAADGRVVYAGSGLRGYGNLVILKHSPNLPHRLRAQPDPARQGRPDGASAARRSPRWARPTPTACSCTSRSGARASRSIRRGSCRRAETRVHGR